MCAQGAVARAALWFAAGNSSRALSRGLAATGHWDEGHIVTIGQLAYNPPIGIAAFADLVPFGPAKKIETPWSEFLHVVPAEAPRSVG